MLFFDQMAVDVVWYMIENKITVKLQEIQCELPI